MEFCGENPEARAGAFCVEKNSFAGMLHFAARQKLVLSCGRTEITVNAYSFTIITAHPL